VLKLPKYKQTILSFYYSPVLIIASCISLSVYVPMSLNAPLIFYTWQRICLFALSICWG